MCAETGHRVEIQPTVSFSIFNELNTEASRDAAAGGSTYPQVLLAFPFFLPPWVHVISVTLKLDM